MNPREAISAQSAEQRKNTRRLPMELLLFLICSFVCIAVFGCGEDIKGIRDMRFGIGIRGGVEAFFDPSDLKKKPTFRGPDHTVYIKGSDVSRSQVAVDQQKNYVVELEFSSEGAKKFADATEKLVGQQIL